MLKVALVYFDGRPRETVDIFTAAGFGVAAHGWRFWGFGVCLVREMVRPWFLLNDLKQIGI